MKAILLTKSNSKQLELDIQKANEQYGDFEIKSFDKSHDRFLIIDSQEIYHLGASLKDLGKRWFAFSKIDESSVKSVIDLIPTWKTNPAINFVFGYAPGSESERIYRQWYREGYHTPKDDLEQKIDWEAAANFNTFFYGLVEKVANGTAAPAWKTGSKLRPVNP